MKGKSREPRHSRRGGLEELQRKANNIRDFILDVCYDIDVPIGPLLKAYGNAVEELVQEMRRRRLLSEVVARLALWLKGVRWADERKLMRSLEGPFETLFVLLVKQVNSGDISPKEAAARWAGEISAAFKATGPSLDPLRIDLDSLEAAFAGAASRHDRFAALYLLRRRRRWRPE